MKSLKTVTTSPGRKTRKHFVAWVVELNRRVSVTTGAIDYSLQIEDMKHSSFGAVVLHWDIPMISEHGMICNNTSFSWPSCGFILLHLFLLTGDKPRY